MQRIAGCTLQPMLKVCLVMGMLLLPGMLLAENPKVKINRKGLYLKDKTQHYLNIHLGGGISASFGKTVPYIDLSPSAGADANVGISYELRKGKFFFNIGVEADYDFSRFRIANFRDSLFLVVHEGEKALQTDDPNAYRPADKPKSVLYELEFRDFQERDHEVMIAVPVQFGWLFTNHIYGAIGVKFAMSQWNAYSANADIQTRMYNANSSVYTPVHVEKEGDLLHYGIYQVRGYHFDGTTQVVQQHKHTLDYPRLYYVSPTLEAGVRLPLRERVNVRIGAYIEYALPIGWTGMQPHVDYSFVSTNTTIDPMHRDLTSAVPDAVRPGYSMPDTGGGMSYKNLEANAIVNSMKNNDFLRSPYNALTFGVRVTFNFNVTSTPHWCNCDNDDL